MNRIDRLSAILIQLQSRKTVKAQYIADRFEISLRTVYRDIRSLEAGGIPIIGESGVGYSLMEGYRLPPVMFTREEATAFITAEKLVAGLTDTANGTSYSSALYKVKAVLGDAEKDFIENIDDRIQVLKAKSAPHLQAEINPLQIILKGIAEKKVLQLNYFAYYRQDHTQRLVEPIGVFYLDNHWHLIAYCRERKACRDFRFDRITDISLTEETFIDVHLSLKDYLKDLYQNIKLQEVIIQVNHHASLYLGEQKYYHGYISETKTTTGVEMYFLTNSMEGFARWFMMFADCAQIIQPEQLMDRVKAIYEAIGEKLKENKILLT